MPWSTPFFDPIELPRGRKLVTLGDAGRYIAGLKKSEQAKPHWRTAIEVLLLIAERGGDPMLARIAMMKALKHGKEPPALAARRKRARVATIIR